MAEERRDSRLGKLPKAGFRMLKMAARSLLAAACFALVSSDVQAEIVDDAKVPEAQRVLSVKPSALNVSIRTMRRAADCLFFRMSETVWQKSLAAALKRADDPTDGLGEGGRKRREALEAGRSLSGLDQLRAVNAFWNKIQWRSDMDAWGQSDKWTSPGEFAIRGGDCEDYAVAKFWTLKELGWPRERLFVMLWREERGMAAHAALTVMDKDGAAWVLDRTGPPMKLEDMRRKRGVPAYVCTEKNTWIATAKKEDDMPAPTVTAERRMPARTAARMRPRRAG